MTPPYLVLHCEEFAWPRMSPPAPVRSYIKPSRAAPFHPSPPEQVSNRNSKPPMAGLFSVALVVIRENLRTVIQQDPSSETSSDAPPLAGSLPLSVRTFLSSVFSTQNLRFHIETREAATVQPALLQGSSILANHVQHVQPRLPVVRHASEGSDK